MNKDKFFILSVDGGGLKGLIALKILEGIVSIVGKPLSGQFDLFAGTSTGGLIVSALNVHDHGKPLYDLQAIEELYLQVGETLLAKGNFLITENETATFDQLLQGTFKDLRLNQTLKPIFVPTYDLTSEKIIVFKTRAAIQNPLKNLSLVDVCRATSAIPPVFPPYRINYNGKKIDCVDAGLYYLKNPALAALAEVWKHRAYYREGGLTESQIVLLSISTGSFTSGSKHWTDSIQDMLSPHGVDVRYIEEQKLKIDLEKINYLRVDLNLGAGMFSLSQLVEWMNKITGMSGDKEYRAAISRLLS